MKVKWMGHACFLISSEAGLKIITDPYTSGGGIRYSPVNETADIVTVSHDHLDHNNVASLSGKPEIVTGSGIREVKGIQSKGVATYHDESQGGQRGSNIVFCFAVDGVKLCHLGDLGIDLVESKLVKLGVLTDCLIRVVVVTQLMVVLLRYFLMT